MTLEELIKEAKQIHYAGMCECGERKFDLSLNNGLAYEPVHESAIEKVRPELLSKVEYYDGYGGIDDF